ncbi:MAG: hypothetical protein KJ065_28460 [Anaerolineae bacterium]|nr:hypothetical protein [Anaerolineae bacterium]
MVWIITALVAGYVAAIFTWPTLRAWASNARAASASLRDKASALYAKIKMFVGS